MTILDELKTGRVIWILYRGLGRATIAVPDSFYASHSSEALSSGSEAEDISGRPLTDAIASVDRIRSAEPEWHCLASIPAGLPDAADTSKVIVDRGWEKLPESVGREIPAMGFDLPFGIWADPSQALLFVSPAPGTRFRMEQDTAHHG